MRWGSCFINDEQIVLCFDEDIPQQCYRSNHPLYLTFTEIEKSVHPHRQIRMTSSKSNFLISPIITPHSQVYGFALGDRTNAATELLSVSNWTWSSGKNFPYWRDLNEFATIIMKCFWCLVDLVRSQKLPNTIRETMNGRNLVVSMRKDSVTTLSPVEAHF